MNQNQIIEKYNNTLHLLGRLTLILATVLLIAVPFIVSVLNDVQPSLSGFINGFIKVGMIYIPMAIVEFLIYTPMLGVGGSYLSFLTGNVTNMKIPVVMNSKEIAQTESGTIEHEIISTISVAVSAMVTMLVIVAGVLLIVPLQPVLQNEALLPAFNNVVPALFGALGFKYFVKSPKIALVPLLVMSLLCVFVPSMISQTSVLLIPSGALALGIGFILFKKNLL
jgi:hypothetical protein